MKLNNEALLVDPENNLAVRGVLLWLTVLILIAQGIVALSLFFGGAVGDSIIVLIALLPILAAFGFAYWKHIQMAGEIIAISLTLMITILATVGQGIYDIGTMAFPAILIIASLILKRNSVLYLAGLIVLCNAWLIFGDILNLYQPTYPQQSLARHFITTSLILGVTVAAVYVLSNLVRDSLISTRNELKERKKAEQALREAETMYRTLVEQTSVIIYRDSPSENTAPIYISPQIEDLLGYSVYEWQTSPDLWMGLTHPDDLPKVLDSIKGYLASGGKGMIEYRMRTKDNRWVWLQDESVVIQDDGGKPLYVHGVLIDITERKNAEQKVKQREAVLSAVAKTAQQLLKASDWKTEIESIIRLLGEATNASHVYVFVNQTGYTDSILTSMKYEWTAPGIPSELNNPKYQGTILMESPDMKEWYANLVNGKPFYGSASEYPGYWNRVFSEEDIKTLLDVPIYVNGGWWGIIGFDDYINEKPWSQAEIDALTAAAGSLGAAIVRQQADEALRVSEEKFQLAFHHTFVPMVISRASDRIILDANQAFCDGTGYDLDEVIGRTGLDLNLWINLEEQKKLASLLAEQDYVSELRTEFRRKSGETGVSLISGVRIILGDEPCFLYTIYDISKIEQLLQELQAKNDELQRFTYTVSHDLRAPLITVSGFVGYLEQDIRAGDWEKVAKDRIRITEGIAKMQNLLTELLELSRIGRLMNPSEEIPFEEIVRDALELVEGRLQARQVQVRVEAGLPSVWGDRTRLTEVVQNLVDNASKFMGEQTNPMIEIGARTDSGKSIFFVRDNGIGIEPEHFDRVFDLFNKLDAKSEGTGIGLALVKRIIEVHGGRIWVESDGMGTGSTFYFTLTKQSGNQ